MEIVDPISSKKYRSTYLLTYALLYIPLVMKENIFFIVIAERAVALSM